MVYEKDKDDKMMIKIVKMKNNFTDPNVSLIFAFLFILTLGTPLSQVDRGST